MPRLKQWTNGKYPVYEALYADGEIRRMSVVMLARDRKKGFIDFESMRRYMHNHRNPPFVFKGAEMLPNYAPPVPIQRGRVWLSDSECVPDPMTENVKPKRVTTATVKKALRELLDAIEEPGADLVSAIDNARRLAA